MNYFISPSILSANFEHLAEDLIQCKRGGADWIHIDVMDGRFVPNITYGPLIVEACRRAVDLPLDVHLMIIEPEKHIEAFAKAGADAITVHVETCPNLHRTLQTIHELKLKAGVTINPGTPIESLTEVISMIDMVLIMSVNPGFGGQNFIPQSLDKITRLKKMMEKFSSPAIIQVDGGVSHENINKLYKAGARNFVAGSAIFNHPGGIGAGIQALRRALSAV
mgnify:CR=1 FL=1